MSNQVFPALPGLGWSVLKTPMWNTRVQKSSSGMELRAAYQSLPLWKWTLTYNVLREAPSLTEFSTLAGFYNARQGMFDSFLYDDPTDDTIASASPFTFATGDGTTTQFQLTRALGGFVEPVYNLNGAPAIYKNGVLQGSGYSVSNGVVTFVSAPAGGVALAWSGAWYWRVRFGADSFDFENLAVLLWGAKSITLLSVKGS